MGRRHYGRRAVWRVVSGTSLRFLGEREPTGWVLGWQSSCANRSSYCVFVPKKPPGCYLATYHLLLHKIKHAGSHPTPHQGLHIKGCTYRKGAARRRDPTELRKGTPSDDGALCRQGSIPVRTGFAARFRRFVRCPQRKKSCGVLKLFWRRTKSSVKDEHRAMPRAFGK